MIISEQLRAGNTKIIISKHSLVNARKIWLRLFANESVITTTIFNTALCSCNITAPTQSTLFGFCLQVIFFLARPTRLHGRMLGSFNSASFWIW